jgi:hypothetical protein
VKRIRDHEGNLEEVEAQEAQRRKGEEGGGPATREHGGPVTVYLDDSQVEEPSGSQQFEAQLSDSETSLILGQFEEVVPELDAELQTIMQRHAVVLASEDPMAIEAVLGTPDSSEPVTTQMSATPDRSEEPVREPVVADVFITQMDEEKVGEAAAEAEADEVTEEAVDEDMSAYLGQEAQAVFDEAVREVLDALVAKATKTSPEYTDYPSRLLRTEVADNPRISALINRVRGEALEGLRAEIWSLLKEEEMVES